MMHQGTMPIRFAYSSGTLGLNQAERSEIRNSFLALKRAPVIVQAMPSIDAGGAEATALWAAEVAAVAGGRSIVASGAGPAERLKRFGAQHLMVSLERSGPLAASSNISRLKKLIEETKADILHVRSREIAWAALQAAQDSRCMVVTSCGDDNVFSNVIRDAGSLADGDCIVAGSNHVKNLIKKADIEKGQRVAVIPDGADLTHYCAESVSAERLAHIARIWGNLEEPSPIILAPGDIGSLRGQTELVRALAIITQNEPRCSDVTLILAGSIGRSDPYARELSRLVSNFRLKNRVFIADQLEDLPAAMLMADLVASVPNQPLGQDTFAAMAAALGKPVVGAYHGATAETVEDNVTGRLCSPVRPDSIAAACTDILTLSAADRNIMARNARLRAEKLFSARKSALALSRLYGALLNSSEKNL